MCIDIKPLFEIIGEKRPVSLQLDLSECEWQGQAPFTKPVTVEGMLENKAGVLFFSFRVSFVLHWECDRCLTEFERPVQYDFSHILVLQTSNESDEYIVVPGGQLDVEELVVSDILLQLPSKLLCKEDCKGLCVKCGQNLNEASCNCSSEKWIDPRLAVLGELWK